MLKEAVSTQRAPGAVGAYSQAVKASGLVFLSGQIGLDPATGKLVDNDVVRQAEQVMNNLNAVLDAAVAWIRQEGSSRALAVHQEENQP